jgi:hypothetical protein
MISITNELKNDLSPEEYEKFIEIAKADELKDGEPE